MDAFLWGTEHKSKYGPLEWEASKGSYGPTGSGEMSQQEGSFL